MKINYNKHVWEGWLVKDFIKELESLVGLAITGASYFKTIQNKTELKKFCMDNQPYYKKHIPEVVNHFAQKYNIK